MEELLLIGALLVAIGEIVVGYMIKNYIPTYMSSKGKNLATKEDIKEITQKQEEVKLEFQKQIQDYNREASFSDKYKYDQYAALYSKIYAIICQSEFLRYMSKEAHGNVILFDRARYIELHKSKHTIDTTLGEYGKTKHVKEIIEDDITRYNKHMINNLILENYMFASPQLIKLAVGHRYCLDYYTAPKDDIHTTYCKNQELSIIKDIVVTVVKEYNQLRKDLKMDYDEKELHSGIINSQIYNIDLE